MAPLHDGLQVVSAASRNADGGKYSRTARSSRTVRAWVYWTVTWPWPWPSRRFVLLMLILAQHRCRRTAGALATPPNWAPSAPWNANAWPDWAMFMPAICFMICSFRESLLHGEVRILAHDHRQRETLRHADDIFVVARVAPPSSSLLLGPRVGHAVAASSPSSSTPRAVPSSSAAASASAVASSSVAAHDLFVCGGARRRRRERLLWLYGCWSRIDVTAMHSSLLVGSESTTYVQANGCSRG